MIKLVIIFLVINFKKGALDTAPSVGERVKHFKCYCEFDTRTID